MSKKMIAPIVVGVLLIAYYIFIFSVLILNSFSVIVNIFFGALSICITGVVIYVVKKRIDEIRGGEYDDISKY